LAEQRKDTQSRKYQLTINNPLTAEIEMPKGSGIIIEFSFDHNRVKENLNKLTTVDYWCMADEIGLNGETSHTHIYFVAHSPIRFSTVKKLFPTAHIESAYGTSRFQKGLPQSERLKELNQIALHQMEVLEDNNNLRYLK